MSLKIFFAVKFLYFNSAMFVVKSNLINSGNVDSDLFFDLLFNLFRLTLGELITPETSIILDLFNKFSIKFCISPS